MLLAHLVPGYFAAKLTSVSWDPQWHRHQRCALWTVAIASTIAPDSDVIYNIVVHRFANHSVLWTHSLLPYLGLAIAWYTFRYIARWSFLRTLLGLVALGGLSHLVLDVIAHGTPLLYPFSLTMFGWPPQQVVDGGLWGYITHPIILLEPLLFISALWHWFWTRSLKS